MRWEEAGPQDETDLAVTIQVRMFRGVPKRDHHLRTKRFWLLQVLSASDKPYMLNAEKHVKGAGTQDPKFDPAVVLYLPISLEKRVHVSTPRSATLSRQARPLPSRLCRP